MDMVQTYIKLLIPGRPIKNVMDTAHGRRRPKPVAADDDTPARPFRRGLYGFYEIELRRGNDILSPQLNNYI
jgi:hypothetical protein